MFGHRSPGLPGRLVAPLLAALLLWGAAAQAAITDGEVRIAVLTDVDGPYSASAGQGSLIAVELAAEDFNDTVAGADIQVRMADHDNDPKVAAKQAKALHAEGVDMIVGMPSSAAALAVQRTLRGTPVVLIHNGAGTTLLTGKECSRTSVHWQYNTAALAAGVGRAVAKDQGGGRWHVMTLDHPFGKGIVDGLRETIEPMGGKVVGVTLHPFNQMRFLPLLRKALEDKPDVLALGNAGSGLVAAIRQSKELPMSMSHTQLVSVMTLLQDIRSVGLYAAAGLQFVVPYYWDATPASRAFSERFRKRDGTVPSSAQISNYVATLHYLKAVAASGQDRGAAVVDTMKQLPINDGITQNGFIRKDGRMVHDMSFMEVKSPEDSKYPMDYFHLIRRLDGKSIFPPPEAHPCPLTQ